jgi:hypothetical protein
MLDPRVSIETARSDPAVSLRPRKPKFANDYLEFSLWIMVLGGLLDGKKQGSKILWHSHFKGFFKTAVFMITGIV